jgi:hypothetical protein
MEEPFDRDGILHAMHDVFALFYAIGHLSFVFVTIGTHRSQ